jgi:conjugal transfer pilus assembly protein TraF
MIVAADALPGGIHVWYYDLLGQGDKKEDQKQQPKQDNDKPEKKFYEDRMRGWYWNEKEPETMTADKLPDQDQKQVSQYPSMKDYSYEQLWNMDPEDFSKLSDRFRNKAIRYPTYENALEYSIMQDVANRKATAFASAMTFASMQHPELSMGDVSPTANPGLVTKRNLREEDLNRTITDGKKDFALIMISQSGCKFCETERGVLQIFERKYGWPIREVDRTASQQNASFAAKHGVEVVPAIVAVYRKTGQDMLVSTGVVDDDTLRRRVYWVMRYLKGETSMEQFLQYQYQDDSGADPTRNLKKYNQSNIKGKNK